MTAKASRPHGAGIGRADTTWLRMPDLLQRDSESEELARLAQLLDHEIARMGTQLPDVRTQLRVVHRRLRRIAGGPEAEEEGDAQMQLEDGPGRCVVCGCTEISACPGGCWWIRPGLCSACQDQEKTVTPEGVRVQAGQTWRDLDRRANGRTVVITRVDVRNGLAWYEHPVRNRVRIDRMRKPMWSLAQDAMQRGDDGWRKADTKHQASAQPAHAP